MLLRAVRWVRAEAPFVVIVLIVMAAALYLFVQPGRWRPGSSIIAGGLLLAGILRLVLPAPSVGLLGVRGRWRDGLTYLLMGGVILAVAIRLHY